MWAILSIIAGFWPFGIVATVYANRSTSLVASGQIGAATELRAGAALDDRLLPHPATVPGTDDRLCPDRARHGLIACRRHDEWQARGVAAPIPLLYSQSSSAGMVPALESQELDMGLVQAVKGAVGGVLADQWKDFYPPTLPSTAALFAAVPRGTNAGRGSNTSGSSNIITNGSKIIVPEGYACCCSRTARSPRSSPNRVATSGVRTI